MNVVSIVRMVKVEGSRRGKTTRRERVESRGAKRADTYNRMLKKPGLRCAPGRDAHFDPEHKAADDRCVVRKKCNSDYWRDNKRIALR